MVRRRGSEEDAPNTALFRAEEWRVELIDQGGWMGERRGSTVEIYESLQI